jgi:hypothetical protein
VLQFASCFPKKELPIPTEEDNHRAVLTIPLWVIKDLDWMTEELMDHADKMERRLRSFMDCAKGHSICWRPSVWTSQPAKGDLQANSVSGHGCSTPTSCSPKRKTRPRDRVEAG